MLATFAVAVLTAGWWGVLGCTAVNDGSEGAAELVQRWFPVQAAEVLGIGAQEVPEVAEAGFALGLSRPAGAWQRLRAELPREGSGWMRLWCADGFEVRLREVGTSGPGTIVDGAVHYGRSVGASFWRTAAGGIEEWLVVQPGAVPDGEPVAVWEVEGAAPRQRGDAVEVVDAGGVARLRVTAPRAFAAGGREIEARLEVRDGAIVLLVEASGGMALVDPLWLPAATMIVGRYWGHTATLLGDGRILIAGGEGPAPLAEVELYDPITDSWTAAAAMNNARTGHTATVLGDGRVLVAGGQWEPEWDGDRTDPIDSVELYDPITDSWTAAAPLRSARHHHTATLLDDGRVLVVGGSGYGGISLDSAEVYDPATDSWTAAAPMLTVRTHHTATLLGDGQVLVAGGSGEGDSDLYSAELYDPVTSSWLAAPPMSIGRRYHTATPLDDGRVLVVGGYDPIIYSGSASAELYDPATSSWIAALPMNEGRYHHTAISLADGRVLAAGGGDLGSPITSAELFDAATNSWSSVPALNVPRSSHTATLLHGGRILVVGGSLDYDRWTEVYAPLGASQWSPTASMSGSRSLHTATLLGDGRVLVAGGDGGAGRARAELYDPVTGSWTAAASMNDARRSHTAALLDDGRVLVAGGFGDGNVLYSAELFDPETGNWTAVAPMNDARRSHTATLLGDGRVLVAGGYGGTDNVLYSAELFDPETGNWTATAPMNNERASHTATLLGDGRVLVTGGSLNGGSSLYSVELFDSATGNWIAAAPMNNARASHTATLLGDGRVLVAGGSGRAGIDFYSADVFDPVTDSWTATAPMNNARASHTATLLGDGRVLVAGGLIYRGTLAASELYDPVTDNWSWAGTMEAARYMHAATLLDNGKFLVVGGWRLDSTLHYLASAEIYSPVPLGSRCVAAADCGSAFCVDGLCCDAPCTGGCMACSAIKKGSGFDGRCGPVQAGTDPDIDCTVEAAPACGNTGVCDGNGACQQRAQGTPCGVLSCSGTYLHQSVCDGMGTCQPGPTASCGNYRCVEGACLPSCKFDSQCADTAYCEGGACLSKKLLGAACALPRECLSGSCLVGSCVLDADNDAIADGEDSCPLNPDSTQNDTDDDGLGDACDGDDDNDGRADVDDNCSLQANTEQVDADGDGEGDTCDCGTSRGQEIPLTCDDGDRCTRKDICQDGVCVGTDPFPCPQPAPVACRIAACEPATGACVQSNAIDGTPCPGGQCIAGGCLVQEAASSTTTAGGGAGGAGGAGSTGTSPGAMNSSTAGASGGADGTSPIADLQDSAPIRFQGNGCSLATHRTTERDAELVAIFAGLALAARRRHRRDRSALGSNAR
ncbi:kelch repeat-containing protein [Sorangium sp. So ce1078]|uniref:kelch repeat-containing protein n=1 Tax=Sorangium sp. So ce1078 TaxID=3133329 RepID=UPI003F5D91C5